MISEQRIGLLAENGVNQRELTITRDILEKAGVKTEIVSGKAVEIKGWEDGNWGIRLKTNRSFGEFSVDEFEGVLIPGGPFHADRIRVHQEILDLVKQFYGEGKLIASIGHGIQVLNSAGILQGLKVTSPPSIRTDLQFGGAIWIDEGVVSDNGIITCRGEEDLEKFTQLILDSLRKGIKQRTESII